MTLFNINPDLYPVSKKAGYKMVNKIVGRPGKICEPSAGKADLVNMVIEKCRNHRPDISVIESDENLQAILTQHDGCRLIDTDFLTYAGPDKFDLIIANPPFSTGDQHLMKMIDIMYNGQIICLLNAETLRNPHSNRRKALARKLDELGADIEYMEGAFVDAERKTSVDIAIVNIIIKQKIEDVLFDKVSDRADDFEESVDNHCKDVSTGPTVKQMVAEFNQVVDVCTETILAFYRNYHTVGSYLNLSQGDVSFHYEDLTDLMCQRVNTMLVDVRRSFWRKALTLDEVKKRLTEKKRMEFEDKLNKTCNLDFTENNIRQFVLNLIDGYEDTLTEAVVEVFDMLTRKHHWEESVHCKNVHYYNGWKTNNAFMVNTKVIIPFFHTNAFWSIWRGANGDWDLDYRASRTLDDIDIVMNYFDGMRDSVSISTALAAAFKEGKSVCESTYFKIKVHKKGTIHLTFLSEDIRRRFNVAACMGKEWLPKGYGTKKVHELSMEEKKVVESFEGLESYSKNVMIPIFATKPNLMIAQ